MWALKVLSELVGMQRCLEISGSLQKFIVLLMYQHHGEMSAAQRDSSLCVKQSVHMGSLSACVVREEALQLFIPSYKAPGRYHKKCMAANWQRWAPPASRSGETTTPCDRDGEEKGGVVLLGEKIREGI